MKDEKKSGRNALLGNKLLSLRHTRPKKCKFMTQKKKLSKNYYVIKSLEKTRKKPILFFHPTENLFRCFLG